MQRTTPAYSSRTDLAGIAPPSPHLKHIQPRIQGLILSYLSFAQLDRHLTELPQQFVQPTTRPWQPIEWQHIDQTQIIGLEPDIFLAILLGATETEAPIRDYTQTSRQYLSPVHPQMAAYVGGGCCHRWNPNRARALGKRGTPTYPRSSENLSSADGSES